MACVFSSKSRIQLNYTVFLECVSQTPFHVDYSWRIETVKSVKLLGLNISSDLKWNVDVSELVRKVSTRLYFVRQFKKSHVATRELLLLYITCINLLYSGVLQPRFYPAVPSYDQLSKRRPRKTAKTRCEDYLP